MGRCIYIPTTPSLIEGSLIPQGQRPCVCGSQPFERFWVPGFLDYQYLSLLARLFPSNSSCTPTFFPLPPPFTLPRPTVGTNRHHLLSFSFLFSFHCCDVLLYTKERIFFVYQPVSMVNCYAPISRKERRKCTPRILSLIAESSSDSTIWNQSNGP